MPHPVDNWMEHVYFYCLPSADREIHALSTGEQAGYVRNPLFDRFCLGMKERFNCREEISYSGCSWERGWNVRFKKSGKTLCILYIREFYFTALVVIGKKEKEAAESVLPDCTRRLQEIYHQTKEGNGQRWLMIDLEDYDAVYDDVFRLIEIKGR